MFITIFVCPLRLSVSDPVLCLFRTKPGVLGDDVDDADLGGLVGGVIPGGLCFDGDAVTVGGGVLGTTTLRGGFGGILLLLLPLPLSLLINDDDGGGGGGEFGDCSL